MTAARCNPISKSRDVARAYGRCRAVNKSQPVPESWDDDKTPTEPQETLAQTLARLRNTEDPRPSITANYPDAHE